MSTYINRLGNKTPSMDERLASDPNQLTGDVADRVAWAMAQDTALSKVKVFASMAKSINDQQ